MYTRTILVVLIIAITTQALTWTQEKCTLHIVNSYYNNVEKNVLLPIKIFYIGENRTSLHVNISIISN